MFDVLLFIRRVWAVCKILIIIFNVVFNGYKSGMKHGKRNVHFINPFIFLIMLIKFFNDQ